MRIGGVGVLVWLVALTLSSCGGASSDDAKACPGASTGLCAAFCGSDVVGETECVNGRWQCPDGYINGRDDCPVGTCFGPPTHCCNSQGDEANGVCPASTDFLPSGGGKCPAGFYDCIFGGPDGGAAGAGASADGG